MSGPEKKRYKVLLYFAAFYYSESHSIVKNSKLACFQAVGKLVEDRCTEQAVRAGSIPGMARLGTQGRIALIISQKGTNKVLTRHFDLRWYLTAGHHDISKSPSIDSYHNSQSNNRIGTCV